MKNQIVVSLSLLLTLLFCVVTSAQAQDNFKLTYDPQADVADIYHVLSESSLESCEDYFSRIVRYSWGSVIEDCKEDLLDKAIGQISDSALTQYHAATINEADSKAVATK